MQTAISLQFNGKDIDLVLWNAWSEEAGVNNAKARVRVPSQEGQITVVVAVLGYFTLTHTILLFTGTTGRIRDLQRTVFLFICFSGG